MKVLDKSQRISRLEHFQSPDIDLIAAPWGFGGTDNLAQEGTHMFLEKDMLAKLEALSITVNLVEEDSLGPFEINEEPGRIRNIEAINQINSWLAKRVTQSIEQKNIPIVLGGDASLCIATVAGLVNAKQNIGILWISNHLANSSPQVTQSRNANRMAFTALTSTEDHASPDFALLQSISEASPIINAENVIHLGINLKSAQSKVSHQFFTMEDIDEFGVRETVSQAINELEKQCEQVHIIWDVNSLNLSGVSNFSLGQLTYREALTIAREIDVKLRRQNKLSSIDIVEHCPSREAWDKRGETAEWVADILANIFGENIFNCMRDY